MLGLFAVCVLLGGYALFEMWRFVVTVRNDNQYAAATDVEVVLKNQRVNQRASIGRVAPGASESLASMKPIGESALDVRFKMGGALCHHLDEYVESGRGYRIEVEIRSCTDVRSAYGMWPTWVKDLPWFRSERSPPRH